MRDIVISQGVGNKLELAVGRNDGSLEDIEWLSSGGNFKTVTLLRTGRAEIVLKPEPIVSYTRCISGDTEIVIGETDGQETIAEARGTFPCYIDADFVNYGTNVKGQATKPLKVRDHELTRNGTFTQIFGGFGENLDRLCLPQSQIPRFCRDHGKWLRADGYATLFLFKENGQYFVASVNRISAGLLVNAYRLSYGLVWDAAYLARIVVPQL